MPKTKAEAKPFLKWAGGKSQLLAQLAPLFPRQFNGYHEPFVGSAAVFFCLYNLKQRGEVKGSMKRASLTDSNEDLINCYRAVRDGVGGVIEWLVEHKRSHSPKYYYAVRSQNPRNMGDVERAARLIYLNKTCYNGLYRVNRKGQFNVPMGRYTNPSIFVPDELRAASRALQEVEIEVADFRNVLKRARRGDFVYFDPPYYPLSKTAHFAEFTSDPFGDFDHKSLALLFTALDEKGCTLMLTNSWTDFTCDLYKCFSRLEVKGRRLINSATNNRGQISQMVVLNKALTNT